MATLLPPEGAREYADSPLRVVAGTIRPTGRAMPTEGGYMLSGRWSLLSGCHIPDWLGLAAFAFEGDAPRMAAEGVPDLRQLMVRREDCQILDTWYSLGMRGTGSTDVVVENLFVPEHRTFSFFIAQPQVGGPLYKVGVLSLFSMSLTSVLLGIARRAIDTFVELASGKVPTLSQSALSSRPTVHAEVARAEALLQSARSFLYSSANEVMQALRNGGSVPDDIEARRRLACVNAAESCKAAVDKVFALAGTSPIYSGHPLEQCLRDIHTAGQHLVVSPAWWEKTGQHYFGQGLGMP